MSDAADMEARSPSSQEGAEEELQHIANHLLTIFARFFDDNQQPMAASFFTFVRACRILDEETTLYEAEAVLEALDTLEVDDPYTTISYEEFYTLLSTLAALKCPADSQASVRAPPRRPGRLTVPALPLSNACARSRSTSSSLATCCRWRSAAPSCRTTLPPSSTAASSTL